MSWTNLPASQATDWSHVDFVNQFINAYNERRDWAFSASAIDNLTAGDYIAPTLLTLMSRLEAICVRFMDPTKLSLVTGASSTVLESALRHTIASWRAAAGLNADGFTRKYPREIEATDDPGEAGQRARSTTDGHFYEYTGGAWTLAADQTSAADLIEAYGHITPGDYIGPWIFNELQAGLQALSQLPSRAQFSAQLYDGSGTSSTSLAGAKSAAEDNLAPAGGSNIEAFSRAIFSPGSGQWSANVIGTDWSGSFNSLLPSPAVGVSFDYEIYIMATPDNFDQIFDDIGLGLSLNAYTLTGSGNTTAPSLASLSIPSGLGSISETQWPAYRDDEPGGAGFQIDRNDCLIIMQPDFQYA